MKSLLQVLLAIILGISTVLAFAPFNFIWVPIASLAVWVIAIEKAGSLKEAFKFGLCWGIGFFGLGVQWVYTTVYTIGGMPQLLGLAMYMFFALYLSVYTAFVALGMKSIKVWLERKNWTYSRYLLWSFLFPALWILSEWLRGEGSLGFNWLTLGYSQTTSQSLAGWARLIGAYGLSYWLVMLAGLCGCLCLEWGEQPLPHYNPLKKIGLKISLITGIYLALYGIGLWSLNYPWTREGEVISVSLIQGNVAQENKWSEQWQVEIFKRYTRLLNEAKSKLVVLPETALPVLKDQLPAPWLQELQTIFHQQKRTVLLGLVERSNVPGIYYNSLWSYGTHPHQFYRKRHLVPFGEFIPGIQWMSFLGKWWEMPLASFSRGESNAYPINVGADIKLAPSICYEDGFSGLFTGRVDRANIFLNISNDAWFGAGVAVDQHLQIAIMRTMEFAKPMIRSNNTAGTAIIDAKGQLNSSLKPFKEGILEGYVIAQEGLTLFARYGMKGVVVLGILGLIAFITECLWKNRKARHHVAQSCKL